MTTLTTGTSSVVDQLSVNWSVFADSEAALIRKGIESGAYEDLAAMIWDVNPNKAEEIAKIQAQLRPRTFKVASQVQKEFEQWLSQNSGHITPAQEAEWQAKMDKEREDALAALSGGASYKLDTEGRSDSAQVKMSNDLHEIDGLGEASIKKLQDAGIYNIEGLRKLSQAERTKILNPLVAAKIKHLQ